MAPAPTVLANGATLNADDKGFLQTDGSLQTFDITLCTIVVGLGPNRCQIDGGTVKLCSGDATAYGSLYVNGSLLFNGGEYDAKINGAGGNYDQIRASVFSIAAGTSKLVVTVNGALAAGTWDIIRNDNGPIANPFATEVLGGTTSSRTNTTPGFYRLTFQGTSPTPRR